MSLLLCPIPKIITEKDGFFKLPNSGYISLDNRNLFSTIRTATKNTLSNLQIVIGNYINKKPVLTIKKNITLKSEGYKIEIGDDGIFIEYGNNAGAFYALMTLNQIITQTRNLPFLKIEDYPDFKIRGYMLDIGRNKIPKLQTILDTVDRISTLKINHFELYIEGAPFSYTSFPEMWENTDTVTPEELMIIDEYCKERFIDFVPNHNTFGHMSEWLKKLPREMAICPDGFYYEPWELHYNFPMSLNPFNEGSIELVKRMSDDLLSNFTSDKFNVNCDEVLELGNGTTTGLSHEELGKVYYDFLMKIHNYCTEKGKTMLYWGDIILHHPELIPLLPKDAIAMNWGYEPNEPTEESCIAFENGNVPYCICPGTSAWKTYTGKTTHMLENLKFSIGNGYKHNALGVLLTDWGDGGHLQAWATSIPGITYSSGLMWGYEDNLDMNLAIAMDTHIFKTDGIGQFLLDVGNWHSLETLYLKNQTVTEKVLNSPLKELTLREVDCYWETVTHDLIDRITKYLDGCLIRLEKLETPKVPDGETVLKEYEIGIYAVKLGQLCCRFKLYFHENNIEGQKNILKEIIDIIPKIIYGYETTWIVKNKYSSLDSSLSFFRNKLTEAKKLLDELT